ncbi:30S ribosomal protein S10 [Rickettsiella endosymbiont of Xylota segnis]|uniref:30S ribosomal protein S10 n=1 Tax=Rickettsiella endosymbiont of Xylota segnis TaxID=3066238 RepID=UPI0030D274C9
MSLKSPDLRIVLLAFDHRLIDATTKEIVNSLKRTGAIISPLPLPTHIKKCTLNTSPHVDKDARDQYEIRTHKRLIDVYASTDKTVDALKYLEALPSNVEIQVKIMSDKKEKSEKKDK